MSLDDPFELKPGRGGVGRVRQPSKGRPRSIDGGAMARAARHVPEVVVKITGAAKVARGIKGALKYIGREGEVALVTDQGTVHRGPGAPDTALRYLTDGAPLPPDAGRKGRPARRETLNLALSMPAGVDPDGFRSGATAFAKAAFPDNAWVLARHDDTKHVHAHLVVRIEGRDGSRLNPRKADLREWREGFAEALRMNGIAANATSRQMRGSPVRGQSQALHHIEQRAMEYVEDGVRPEPSTVYDRIRNGPETPERKAAARRAVAAARASAKRRYLERAQALKASGSPANWQIGASLDAFMRSWDPDPPRRADITRARFVAADRVRRGLAPVPQPDANDAGRAVSNRPPGPPLIKPAGRDRDDGPER